MIIKPIIPIWLMTIICITLIIFIVYSKQLKRIIVKKSENEERTPRQKKLIKYHILDSSIKVIIVILLFLINLRFMIPNGETTALNSNIHILFVIDKSVSMKALDYDKDKERIEGVKNDTCRIVEELAGSKFSIITFGDLVKRVLPFTDDTNTVKSELNAITVEDDVHAQGTSLNDVREVLETTLKNEKERKGIDSKIIVFFISDGEITKENETLESFSDMSQYVSGGAVLGYGTTDGGKMFREGYEDKPNDEYSYVYYYDDNEKSTSYRKVAVSKLDENNLNKISSDLGIQYIKMDNPDNINAKIREIKEEISNTQTADENINAYNDIYYYLAFPLVALLIVEFVIQKRRM